MSSPDAFSEDEINELIWGSLESEIIDCGFSLRVASDVISWTEDLVVQLFYGFLYFMHYKCGLRPTLTLDEERDLRGVDLDDPSVWAESLMSVGREKEKPYSSRHFADKNDDIHTVIVLTDTYALFECGMMLNETRLEGESRFSYSEMAEEFHVMSENLPRMLAYFKYLHDAGWGERGHTLVLRPTKMMEYLAILNQGMIPGGGCPDKVIRTEEWETMSDLDKIVTNRNGSAAVCNEANFRELLRKRSMEIPNVQFPTFYEYMRHKIPSWAASEWTDVRDRYIALIKRMIAEEFTKPDRMSLAEAKKVLAEADRLLEEKRFPESLSRSYISMEGFLNASVRKTMSIPDKIKIVTRRPPLRRHRAGLLYVKEARNEVQHAGGTGECSEDTARYALDMMNEFLSDVEKSPYDARDTQPFSGGGGVPSSAKTNPVQSTGQDAK